MSMKSPAGLTLHKYVVLSMEILFWLVSILTVFCCICITLKVLQSFRNSGSNNRHVKKRRPSYKSRVFLCDFSHVILITSCLSEILESNGCIQMWVETFYAFVLWVSTTNVSLHPLLYIYLWRYRDKLVVIKALGTCAVFYSGERE